MAKEEGPRSFARFLENVGEGDFHQDASDALFDLGKSIQDLALQRVDLVFEDAIADAATKVAESTGLPVFRGKPD
jgi:hypothetical protein